MKAVCVEGVYLSEKSLKLLREWQEKDNLELNDLLSLLDEAVYRLACPMTDDLEEKDRLMLISNLLYSKKKLSNLKCEDHEEEREN